MTILEANFKTYIEEVYKDDKFRRKFTLKLYDYVKNTVIKNDNLLSKTIISYGGFVAGGFARWIVFAATTIKEPYFVLLDGDLKDILSKYFDKMFGDIDIFFEKQNQFNAVTERTADDLIEIDLAFENNSYAETFFTGPNENGWKTQLIGFCFGTPREILEKFDIVNAQLAIDFNSDKIFYNPDIINLEKTRTLSLYHIGPQEKKLISRVLKYVLKYEYLSFDKTNNSCLNLIKYYFRLKEKLNEKEALRNLVERSNIIPIVHLTLLIGQLQTKFGSTAWNHIKIVDTVTRKLQEIDQGKCYLT